MEENKWASPCEHYIKGTNLPCDKNSDRKEMTWLDKKI